MPDAQQLFDRRSIPDQAHEAYWHAADGWPIRRIDFQPRFEAGGAARGGLLFLSGRGDHYEKYLETLNHFAAQGWHVTAIDWRGQGGSGRLLPDPHIGHIDDFGTWVADLRYFWDLWAGEMKGPHVILAHSMGGHLAVRAMAESAVCPDAVALSAPMLGIHHMGVPWPLYHMIARLLGRVGGVTNAAWKEGEKPGSPINLRSSILTHDAERYADELYWWRARPEVRLGPPSWHWVERAIASIRGLDAPGVLEAIATPILILATSADRLVDTARIKRDAQRLPNCELRVFGKEAAHELLREADPVRDTCLHAIDHFFDRHAPVR